MKKYKHKQSNSIAEQTDHIRIYKVNTDLGEVTHVPSSLIENTNDWEEVKEEVKPKGPIFGVSVMKEEPNYLITAFRDLRQGRDNILYKINSEGNYYSGSGFPGIPLIKMLKVGDCVQSGHFEMYSVKNSKGEEFTIGDKVTDKVECFIIESFDLNEAYIDGCFARGKGDGRVVGCSIKLLEKVKKQPIYTTTDGKEIYEGDRVWLSLLHKDLSLHENDLVLVGNFSQKDKEVADRYLTFTSEENRDKYIKENQRKPIFVSADNVEIFDYDYNLFSIYPRDTWTEKKCRVKQAIEFKNWLHFHTKEARQEYIDNNKPKFSFADIFTASEKIPSGYLTTTGLLDELKKLGK